MITVVVQAGGDARRMGRDKGLVPLAGRPLIEHVLERVAGLGTETLITTNHPESYAYLGLPLASDRDPGLGALGGLRTALEAAGGETVLVLACDMPFLHRPLLRHLLSLAPGADAVIPRRGGEYEPLHAAYARRCLPAIEASLERGQRRMISFYPQVRILEVGERVLAQFDPKGYSFFNVNTPEDLRCAERMIRAGEG